VNIVLRIIWGIVLDDPVNFGKVEASLSDISAKENTLVTLAEFKVG